MKFNEFIELVERMLGQVSEVQRERLRLMEDLYRDWNCKINVISRKDMDEFYMHHVLHSLAIAVYMKSFLPEDFAAATRGGERQEERLKILDVGTGGGFPGVPMAIVFPGAQFTLCDSVGKKVMVAADVVRQLGLENVTTVNARAESLTDTYDYVVSRAVASLVDFIPWVRRRFRRGILYLKGGDAVAEETALAMARFRLRRGSVHTWRIDSRFEDEYFDGKYVIFIENFCK
ncbi:MAG: 16S rRNA (guanine(527)-N(7))-methyltransferase RsmG [Bacteroidales bacterium]|nr:16S rRNA (guanine(527)-N(7))-methyltransferase RsmG [Bacteroidales bacterium]